jgi:HSP20 family protein
MKSLVPRESLYQDLFDFRHDFEQIFNRIFLGKPLMEGFVPTPKFEFLPAVESYVDKEAKKYICRVSLPGIEPKDVEIHATESLLKIKGERKFTRTTKEVDLLNEEMSYGWFERELELPEYVVTEKLTAEYRNGVLEITAPVAAAALPRKIEIKTVPIAKQVTA